MKVRGAGAAELSGSASRFGDAVRHAEFRVVKGVVGWS